MREQIQQFLESITVEKGYSQNTLAAYRNDLSQFLAFLQGRVSGWDEVDRDTILDYVMFMKSEQEYASSTVARKVAAIKSFFHWMVERGLLQDDPTATLDSPKVRKRLPKAVSPDDMERLLNEPARERTPKALRDRALLEMLYATGLRVTELVSLNVDDVNLASSTARVVRPKDRRERIVPIHSRALGPMQDYLERGRMQLLRGPDEMALFLNHRGKRLTRQGLWLIVKHYVREVGIDEGVTPHTLRHSFAAHLVDNKAELEYVKQILGHANISTTQIYTHVSSEDARDEETLGVVKNDTRGMRPALGGEHVERNAMGYVENIMGDNERTVYQTHQHAIVLLERILLWLLALVVFLGLGLTLLLSGDDQTGARIRWYIGLVLLISLLIPAYMIASAWIDGLRGRDLLKHVWRSAVAGVVILVIALFIMIRPEFRVTGWIGIAVAVIPLFELARIFLDWLNERYIITNRRVMEVRGIINKHVRDSALEKVNDVDLNQSVVGRLLGYGTVQIITGSDIGVNKFQRISNPVRFKRAMLNAKEQLHVKAEVQLEEPAHPKAATDDAGATALEPAPVSGDDIPELIAELAELHEKGVISEEEFQAKKTELLDRL